MGNLLCQAEGPSPATPIPSFLNVLSPTQLTVILWGKKNHAEIHN
jgi:hypothetical protein